MRKSDVAEAIAGYLQENEVLMERSDASLHIAPLRQAASHSRREYPLPLSRHFHLPYPDGRVYGHALTVSALPIDAILQSMGVLVFSEISAERLPIRAFYTTDSGVQQHIASYLDALQLRYSKLVDEQVSVLARLSATSRSILESPKADLTTTHSSTRSPPTSPSNVSTSSPSKEQRTLKRSHSRASLTTPNDENRSPHRAGEVKAIKNAKLLKALRDVEKTLGSMEVEIEEQQRMNEVF